MKFLSAYEPFRRGKSEQIFHNNTKSKFFLGYFVAHCSDIFVNIMKFN